MRNPSSLLLGLGLGFVLGLVSLGVYSREDAKKARKGGVRDAVAEAQTPEEVEAARPEQKKGRHDRSDVFEPVNSPPSSTALADQPEKGRIVGFDFSRDPLDAKRPMMSLSEIMKEDERMKPKVMALQRKLLNSRYDLKPRFDPEVKMSRGKPLCLGPTARLGKGMSWEALAKMAPGDVRKEGIFPYPPLPHPKHTPGGMVFIRSQIKMFPRLERFDVEFDIPEEFLPEFPPAMFLQNRPELGDVSRGEVVSINNFMRLFKDIMTPVQLDGMRLLLTPLPQEEFNPTDDRKTREPSLGVTCLDCHVNGHTSGQIELNPDIRPQQRRFRLDTPTIRGAYNQQIFGSKRSIRSLKDFAQFEHRTAYFNGDHIHAFKKGVIFFTPQQAAHMERAQSMFDWPPAPKLDRTGRLNNKATKSELRGEKLFHGKAQCAVCHPPPFFVDDKMHDLKLERFTKEPGDGPIKSFSLRGIKDSPPYLHDGRCLTLEDTVEFFNLVLELKLTKEEKKDLTAFLKAL